MRDMRLVALLLAIATLTACETLTGPNRTCFWHYTKTEWRDTVLVDTVHHTAITLRREVPTDSVKVCGWPADG